MYEGMSNHNLAKPLSQFRRAPRKFHTFATVPERSRRLLELATIKEGAEAPQDQRKSNGQATLLSDGLPILRVRSAYSDTEDDEQVRPSACDWHSIVLVSSAVYMMFCTMHSKLEKL